MSGAASSLTVRVPLAIRRQPGRKTVVTPTGAAANTTAVTRGDPALLKALARAFRYQRLLDDGRYASISELAAAERIERAYVGQLLRLTLLAPDVAESLLNGLSPPELNLPRLMGPFPINWTEQRVTLALHHTPRSITREPDYLHSRRQWPPPANLRRPGG